MIRNSRILVSLLLLVACAGCGVQPRNFKTIKLPSGKEIKVTSMGEMGFPNSPAALVMDYVTVISIDDKAALRKEVDEIWSVFQIDVENAHLKAGVIRATQVSNGWFMKSGRGYGFVFVKRDDDKWHCLEDEKTQTK